MPEVIFFVPKGPFSLNEICENGNNLKISDIKTLDKATSKDITFLNSIDYKNSALSTKAGACITTKNLEQFLPKTCIKILVKNVLFSTAKISQKFYPHAHLDYLDKTLVNVSKISKKFKSVTFGKNIFIGKDVKIGNNSHVASNTVIESNVQIGESCLIGYNVIIKNSSSNKKSGK